MVQLWTLVAKSASHSTIYWTNGFVLVQSIQKTFSLKLSMHTSAITSDTLSAASYHSAKALQPNPQVQTAEVALWKLAHTTLNGRRFIATQLARYYYLVNNIAWTSTVFFFTFAFTFISLNLSLSSFPMTAKMNLSWVWKELHLVLLYFSIHSYLYIMACVRPYSVSLPLSQPQMSLPY